jgi:hypothetical protein
LLIVPFLEEFLQGCRLSIETTLFFEEEPLFNRDPRLKLKESL